MEKLIEIYNSYRDYILFSILFVIFMISCAFIFWYFSNDLTDIKKKLEENTVEEKVEEVSIGKFIVDIKGEVKKPGVYILEEDKRVIDVVKKAGGFTSDADTSANNLSMKIKDEMVIIIYSESEIAEYVSTKEKEKQINDMCKTDVVVNDSCVSLEKTSGSNSNNSSIDKNSKNDNNSENNNNSESVKNDGNEENKLVSLNNATLDELMTLPGIGESKAKAIIEYREENSFATIEDIKNVSGIGDALFEKIKDYITT